MVYDFCNFLNNTMLTLYCLAKMLTSLPCYDINICSNVMFYSYGSSEISSRNLINSDRYYDVLLIIVQEKM